MQEDPQNLVDENSPNGIHNANGSIQSITDTFANLAHSHIDGFDFSVQYVLGDPYTSWGQAVFQYNSTVLLNYIIDDGTGSQEVIGTDANSGLGPLSRYRQDVSATWNYHGLSFTLSNDLTSSYADSEAAPSSAGTLPDGQSIERNVATYVVFNLQASYTFEKQEMDKFIPGPRNGDFDWRNIVAGTTITVGCNNIWDFQPPFTADTNDNLGYDPGYADPTGRFIYAELTKRF